MSDIKTRLAAWYLGRKVQPEATRWAEQVLDAMDDLHLVLIDPEDETQVESLYPPNWHRDPESIEWFQKHLCSLVAHPKPEVYSHRVIFEAEGLKRSACGKVWVTETDVTVVGKCPECKSESWSA